MIRARRPRRRASFLVVQLGKLGFGSSSAKLRFAGGLRSYTAFYDGRMSGGGGACRVESPIRRTSPARKRATRGGWQTAQAGAFRNQAHRVLTPPGVTLRRQVKRDFWVESEKKKKAAEEVRKEKSLANKEARAAKVAAAAPLVVVALAWTHPR